MTAAHRAGRVAPARSASLFLVGPVDNTARLAFASRGAWQAPRSAAAPPLFPRCTICRRRVLVGAVRAFTSCIGVPASPVTLPPFPASAFVLTVSLRVTTMLAA